MPNINVTNKNFENALFMKSPFVQSQCDYGTKLVVGKGVLVSKPSILI